MLVILFSACQPVSDRQEKADANLALASRYFTEVYNQDKLDLIDELFAEGYTHTNTEGRVFAGREELKAAVRRIEGLLPNLELEIEEAVADEEKAIFVIRMRSDLPQMASTATTASGTDFNETFVFWIQEGKIYKGRSIGAHLPFVKQVTGYEGGLLDLMKTLMEPADSLIQ